MKNISYRLKDIAYASIVLWAIGLTLYFGSNIIFPIVFSFFISLLLLPLVERGIRLGMNNLFSCLLVVVLCTGAIGGLSIYLVTEGYELIEEFSVEEAKKKAEEPLNAIEKTTKKINKQFGLNSEALNNNMKLITSVTGDAASYIFSGIQRTIVFMALVPIYIFFMLYYRANLITFIRRISSKNNYAEKYLALKDIKAMIQKYLSGLSIVILIVATLNTIALLLFDIDYAFFIGILTGLLIIIPYIGVFFGALIPVAVALATKDSIYIPMGILASYIVIQFIEGNFITPRIVGDSINLNPLVIIIGLIIFGSVGGILAAIVAVPCLATLKIIFDHTEVLKPYAVLMSYNQQNEPKGDERMK